MLPLVSCEPLPYKLLSHCLHGQRLARKYFEQKVSLADKFRSVLSIVIKLHFRELGERKYFVM